MALVVSLSATSSASPASAQQDPEDDLEVEPVSVALVVDESGSLDEPAVAAERNAVAAVVQAELSEQTDVAVFGFGSSNSAGQNAVTTYCSSTTLGDSAVRELVNCSSGIHRRTDVEGVDTDFVAALRSGIDSLAASPAEAKVLFLLTDGVLDVRKTAPSMVGIRKSRMAEAQRRLNEEVLPYASDSGVQIWPIGFGNADLSALQLFAQGGAQDIGECSSGPTIPTAFVAQSTSQVVSVFIKALAAARCAQSGEVIVENPQPGVIDLPLTYSRPWLPTARSW